MSPSSPSRRRLLAFGLALPLSGLSVGVLSGCGEPKQTKATTSLFPKARGVLVLLDAAATHPPGTRSLAELLGEKLTGAEVVVNKTHEEQVKRIEGAEADGVGLLVVQAVDPSQVGPSLKKAADADVKVIALEAIPHQLDGLSLVLGWDEFSIGEQEVDAVAKFLPAKEPPRHLELFAGAPDDLRAKARFVGSMLAMKPLTAEGTMVVKSGQTSFETAALSPDETEALDGRLSTTYEVTYARHSLDALIIPDDGYAPEVTRTCTKLKKKPPLLLSSGATEAGVRGVMSGGFFSTIYRDPAVLADRLSTVVAAIHQRQPLDYNPQSSHRNYVKGVPGIMISPRLVTRATAASLLGGNPRLAPLVKG